MGEGPPCFSVVQSTLCAVLVVIMLVVIGDYNASAIEGAGPTLRSRDGYSMIFNLKTSLIQLSHRWPFGCEWTGAATNV